MQHLHFIPIHSPLKIDRFDAGDHIAACISDSQENLQTGDILIVSSKFAAVAEGRVMHLHSITPSKYAERMAQRYNMSPSLAQLVLQECEQILGGVNGFALTLKSGMVIPNAGIDASNVPQGYVVMHPIDPFASARRIRASLCERCKADIGVIIADSNLTPAREGTTGIAIGVAGFRPVENDRGKPDLLGKPLQVSRRAIADTLCSAAEFLMGEAAEGIPIVIARNTGIKLTEDEYSYHDLAIPQSRDIYISLMHGADKRE